MLITEIVQSRVKSNFLSDNEKSTLEQKCKPFLEEIGYDVDRYTLLRGSRLSDPSSMIPGTRMFFGPGAIENRTPKAMPVSIHKRLNDLFISKFGIPFRNSAFATGDYEQAADFGTVCMFFPVGEFKYCWSPYQKDLFHSIDKKDGKFTDNELKEIVDTYQTTNLKQAIIDKVEIMVYCQNSILIQAPE